MKTLLPIGYFAYVPCFMICMYIIYGNIYLDDKQLCTIVTITKIKDTLDLLDNKPMIYI